MPCRTYMLGSPPAAANPRSLSTAASFSCHARGACLSPYRARRNLSAMLLLPCWYPSGCCTHTSSPNSPLRKAVQMSSWCSSRSSAATLASRQRRVGAMATGAYSSPCSHGRCAHPLATSLALWRGWPCSPSFTDNTHRSCRGRAPGGSGSNSHVLFASSALISSSIAANHCSRSGALAASARLCGTSPAATKATHGPSSPALLLTATFAAHCPCP
mmetsp:Transcript_638/g.1549  ORF Transcript_638/g.1549 Transcript_638/m.1549 type:complete len:216 (-) Transcript_638:174-821(-)